MGRNKILVVDDEPSIRKALALGLTSDEFEVDVVADGQAGIDMGIRKQYDILLVDLCLPDMDGLQVIREVKHASPEIISIMITGKSSLESSIEAIQLEVKDYIEKPLELQMVKNSISEALTKRESNYRMIQAKQKERLELAIDEHLSRKEIEAKNKKSLPEQFSETTSSLVHQLNNPLMCITGSAELALRQLADREAIHQYLKNIQAAVKRISVINEKVTSHDGLAEYETKDIKIKPLIEDKLHMFNDLLSHKKISVATEFKDHDLRIPGSSFFIGQVLSNLILNAIDAMNLAPRKLLKITAAAGPGGSHVVVRVRDTGCGIPAETMEKIFTPYFTTKRHSKGLGMSIVKSIVEKHKGTIEVESAAGKGTTFTLSLAAA